MKKKYANAFLLLMSLTLLFGCTYSTEPRLNTIAYISIPIEEVEKTYELTPFEDQKTRLHGYKDKSKKVVIPPMFSIALNFDKYGIADVTLGYNHNKWFKINKDGHLLTESYFFDNGPDYYVNGLSRFVKNNKIGFIDHNANIVIPARFDWASTFSYSVPIAVVCNGCKATNVTGEKEHREIKGGRWGAINIHGDVIVPIEFEDYRVHNELVIFKMGSEFYKLMHNARVDIFLKKLSSSKVFVKNEDE